MQVRTLHVLYLHIRLYLFILTVLIGVFTCINRSSAGGIYDGTQGDNIREAEIKRDDAKGVAGAALNTLQDYREVMGNLLGKYDSNNSALLSNRLEQFTWLNGVSLTSFIKNAIEKNILLNEKDTLSSALDTAIGAVESQIQTLKRKINYYHGKWYDVTVLISAHNRDHSSPSERNHSWDAKKPHDYNDDLPEFSCFGGCGTTMSTPGRAETLHQWTCGPTLLTKGCGEKYYSCPPDYSIPDWHRVFSCTRYNKVISNGAWVKEFCNATFQYCTNRLHGELTSNGVCSKRLGSGTPGEHSNSDQDISNIIVPEDPPISSGSTTCSGCGVSYSSSEASDHEWVYESCPSSHAHYECDGTDHSLQASCSSTDANGNSCTVTNFYACDSHTHSYPAPPAPPTVLCGNSWTGAGACIYGRVASSRTEHQATCSTHGTYWSCNPTAQAWHGDLHTCTRPGCGASYTKCTKGDGTCSGGRYTWHN